MQLDFNNLSTSNTLAENKFDEKILSFIKDWYSDKKTVSVQTSGSTGTPKILEISKEKMLNSAQMTCDFLGLEQGNIALICLPIEYISGKMMIARAIERKLILISSTPSTQPLINLNQPIDFCAMTPLQVENSLDKIHLIKNLIIGGASVSDQLKEKIYSVLKSKQNIQNYIFETYGMSETLSHIALKSIFPEQEKFFKVLSNISINKDSRGCLEICAPKLTDSKITTNDLIEIKENLYFRFLGRIDNVINSAGAKIFPEELEKIVKSKIPNEVVFLGLEDEILGQKLVLVVENHNGDKNLQQKIEKIQFEKKFHQPKQIFFIEKIPRTPNNKVNRNALKTLIQQIN